MKGAPSWLSWSSWLSAFVPVLACASRSATSAGCTVRNRAGSFLGGLSVFFRFFTDSEDRQRQRRQQHAADGADSSDQIRAGGVDPRPIGDGGFHPPLRPRRAARPQCRVKENGSRKGEKNTEGREELRLRFSSFAVLLTLPAAVDRDRARPHLGARCNPCKSAQSAVPLKAPPRSGLDAKLEAPDSRPFPGIPCTFVLLTRH